MRFCHTFNVPKNCNSFATIGTGPQADRRMYKQKNRWIDGQIDFEVEIMM